MNKPQLNKWKIAASLAFLALLAFVSTASAAVLFTDNFNIGAGGDPNANLNLNFDLANRQAGPLAPATYTGNADHHQVGNTGTDVGQPGAPSYGGYVLTALNGKWQSDLNIAAVSTGPLTIEFDMYELTNSSTEWGACSLRLSGDPFPVAGADEFGFLRRRNGGVQVFQNGNVSGTGSWDTGNFALDPHWKLIFTDTAGTGSAFNGNGSKVTMINGTAWTNTLTLGQLKRSGLKLGFNASGGGFAGIDNLAISGTQPAILVTTANQSGANPFTPSWTPETPDLVFGLSPTTANGDFAKEGSGGTPVLTDGTIGTSGTIGGFATCGNGSGSGNTLIFTLTNVVNGTDVTNIVVYSGWGDGGRHGQYYDLSYSTIAAPTTYIPITTVFYLPGFSGGAPANRVAIAMNNGTPLASGVANIKFDFSSPPSSSSFNNGYQGYSEIIVQGSDTAAPPPPPSPFLVQDTLPTRAETVVGDQVVFTAAFSNAPPVNLQWQQVLPAATNNINTGVVTVTNSGIVTSTLTLNNVQLNSGSYRLKADNATNGAAAPSYSAAAPLAVGTAATVGNVVVKYAGQAGPASFYPAWTINTPDLIAGFPTDGSGNPGTATAGAGNFGIEAGLSGDPTILADGILGATKSSMVSCGPQGPSGLTMTYYLNTVSSPNGFDLTNIVIYGGWPDDGRNEQKYQVLYSTVAAPATFSSIGTFDYNPSFNSGEPNATRVTLVPAAGVLAQNVAAVQINWNLQGSPPKNGWEGYSEITIGGTNGAAVPVLTMDINPLTAEDVVGSSLTLTAGFNGATSYQWQKNGTDIPLATSSSLTLNNLQLSDTATNGGYRLKAINGAGTSVTRGCAVIVNPAPAAIGNTIVAYANQASDAASFAPTWNTSTFGSSLISGASPGDFGPGNFLDPDGNPVSHNLAGGLPVLTDGDYGSVVDDGTHAAFATCGPAAGQYVTYTLPADVNGYGYDLTNILVASGWNNDGRNADWATISYSTVTNPGIFLPLAVVTNRPILGNKSEIRATITPATGVLARNVYAVMFSFEWPQGIPNGYSGISQLNVLGSPSATPPPAGPVITAQHEEYTDAFVLETPNLIANQLPGSFGPGIFTQEGCTEAGLTDGVLSFGGNANSGGCGADGISVPWVIFNSGTGWDLTNIVVYSLWHDFGRDGQFYNVSYSTISAPATFLPLASVAYNPFVPHDGRASGNRVAITPAVGQTLLAANVAAVKFDFTPQGGQDFGWSGYTEIVLQGSSLAAPTLPVLAGVTAVGGNLILTGAGGTPNYGYTIVTSTNLLTPAANWTVGATGVLNGSGAFSNAIPINVSQPATFFRLRML